MNKRFNKKKKLQKNKCSLDYLDIANIGNNLLQIVKYYDWSSNIFLNYTVNKSDKLFLAICRIKIVIDSRISGYLWV